MAYVKRLKSTKLPTSMYYLFDIWNFLLILTVITLVEGCLQPRQDPKWDNRAPNGRLTLLDKDKEYEYVFRLLCL